MKCTGKTLLMRSSCVVCGFCTPGHVYMARCIRLLYRIICKELLVAGCEDCNAQITDISQMTNTDSC